MSDYEAKQAKVDEIRQANEARRIARGKPIPGQGPPVELGPEKRREAARERGRARFNERGKER